jgi:hypothetical protein
LRSQSQRRAAQPLGSKRAKQDQRSQAQLMQERTAAALRRARRTAGWTAEQEAAVRASVQAKFAGEADQVTLSIKTLKNIEPLASGRAHTDITCTLSPTRVLLCCQHSRGLWPRGELLVGIIGIPISQSRDPYDNPIRELMQLAYSSSIDAQCMLHFIFDSMSELNHHIGLAAGPDGTCK